MSEFIVVKDGTEMKAYKTFPAAKKLADTEGAEVFHDGECVYTGTETVPEVHVPEKYRLKARMNVRKEPSVEAEKLRTLPTGAVVEVISIQEELQGTDRRGADGNGSRLRQGNHGGQHDHREENQAVKARQNTEKASTITAGAFLCPQICGEGRS